MCPLDAKTWDTSPRDKILTIESAQVASISQRHFDPRLLCCRARSKFLRWIIRCASSRIQSDRTAMLFRIRTFPIAGSLVIKRAPMPVANQSFVLTHSQNPHVSLRVSIQIDQDSQIVYNNHKNNHTSTPRHHDLATHAVDLPGHSVYCCLCGSGGSQCPHKG